MTQNQTTSLVKTPAGGAIAKWNATPEQVQLLKNTIAKGTTDEEFSLFMTVAMQMELNPFLRQIHAVRRWDPEQERMVMQIQTGIDGYRLMAERSGVYGGQEGPWWCGDDGQWVDVWLAKVAPAAAKVVVHRTDKPRPFIAIALWTEYAQTKKDGTLTAMWRKRGPGQLAKCAEALAFRRAFPIEIGGGAHVDVEMDYIEAEAVEHPQPQFVAPPPPQGPPPGVPVHAVGHAGPVGTSQPMQAVTVTDTGTKPTETKRGPGRPPKAQPSQTPGTDPFRAAREEVDRRAAEAKAAEAKIAEGTRGGPTAPAEEAPSGPAVDRWGQPIGDPTSAGGSSEPAASTSATATTSTSASSETPSAGADDGFGGEDPADSQPAPTGDPGLQLIEDLKVFLAGCKSQTEMQNGRPPFHQRSQALFRGGDKRFEAAANGKPAGELAALLGKLWAERKAQLPV